MLPEPVALNALTTRALGASRATVSPPESPNPIASSLLDLRGSVASISTLPAKAPSDLIVASTAVQGTASTITSVLVAALFGVPPRQNLPLLTHPLCRQPPRVSRTSPYAPS